MNCPECSFDSTRVVDSRVSEARDSIRRRRECERCAARFTTYERAEAPRVVVLKRDGRREAFDRQKLLRGLVRAANKRPVSEQQLDELADRIAAQVRRGGREADAEWIGELSLRGLAELDPVSAILFASVYRKFSDLTELEAEVRRLKEEPASLEGQLALDPAGSDPSDPASTIFNPLQRARGRKNRPEITRRDHAAHP